MLLLKDRIIELFYFVFESKTRAHQDSLIKHPNFFIKTILLIKTRRRECRNFFYDFISQLIRKEAMAHGEWTDIWMVVPLGHIMESYKHVK